MAVQSYECLVIFDSNKYARDQAGVSSTIASMVEKCGGEVLVSRLWAEQRLAYQIGNHQKGTYWLTYFKMDSLKVVEFNQMARLQESIVRYMVTVVDPRLIDALVAHAQGKSVSIEGQPVAAGVTIDHDDADLEDGEESDDL